MSFYKNIGVTREVKKQRFLDNFNDWLWGIQIRDLEWRCYDENLTDEGDYLDHYKDIHWVLRYLCEQTLDEDIQSPESSILIKLYHVLCEWYLRFYPGVCTWQTIRRCYEEAYGCEIYDDFQISDGSDAEVKGAFEEFDMFTEFLSGSSVVFERVNRKVLELR